MTFLREHVFNWGILSICLSTWYRLSSASARSYLPSDVICFLYNGESGPLVCSVYGSSFCILFYFYLYFSTYLQLIVLHCSLLFSNRVKVRLLEKIDDCTWVYGKEAFGLPVFLFLIHCMVFTFTCQFDITLHAAHLSCGTSWMSSFLPNQLNKLWMGVVWWML